MPTPTVTIRKGREKPIRNQHPWIFSGAIYKVEDATPGDIVTVIDHAGHFLARGYWNPKSAIQVRLLTWQDEPIDEAWWRQMLQRAINSRATQAEVSHACRLVNAENDFLPGLIVDKYGAWVVLQALTLYIDQQKDMIANLLADLLKPKGIYERSDVDVREKEGLQQTKGLLWGEEPPERIEINVLSKMLIDIRNGHKTGTYLDQFGNFSSMTHIIRDLERLSKSERPTQMLNTFSYTGGFALAASRVPHSSAVSVDTFAGGTHCVNVDASYDALELAEQNFHLNDFAKNISAEFIQADVFEYLRDCVERGDEYDIVILDPPKFAHNKQQVQSASRGYKDINLNAFKIIRPGGYLMTFSCSGAINRDLFQKIVFGALADSGRRAQLIEHLSASDDHPVALTFPEGEYLKGLLLRVY